MRMTGAAALPYAAGVLAVGAALWAVSFGKLEPADFTFCNGDEIKTVDPAGVTGHPEGQVVRALFEGLCNWHPQTLAPIPAAAKSWDISDDKLTYTFHLRDNAVWSDGSPVTAEDFRWSFRRFLHPSTAAEYAYELYYVENAQRFNESKKKVGDLVEVEWPKPANDPHPHAAGAVEKGKLVAIEEPQGQETETTYTVEIGGRARRLKKGSQPHDKTEDYAWLLPDFDTVAITVVDERTLRIKLHSPTPYFLSLMGFYPMFPVNRRCVETHGHPHWMKPENIVSNGPFTLKERRIRDRIRLQKNETYWGRENIHFNTVDVLAVKSGATMLNLYLTGAVDWIPQVPSTTLDGLKAQNREDFKPAPYFGTYYYRINVTDPQLKDVRVRRALGMAMDKREIVEKITRAGQIPARSLTPVSIRDYMPYDAPLAPDYNPAEARRLLAEAGYPGGRGFQPIDILYNVSEDHKAIAELIQSQWQRNLGIDCGLQAMEWASCTEAQKQLQYKVARIAWIGDYADPNTFINMFVTGGGNNQTGWSNQRYDELVDAAQREPDPRRRLDLYRQAEQILMDEAPIIPIYHYVSTEMVRTYVKGYYQNIQNVHPLHGMRIDQEEKQRVLEAEGLW